MVRMWICPYCQGRTVPITLEEVDDPEMRRRVLEEMKNLENPVIVKCTKCRRVWVDEI
jgi:PII-like signaling protein